MTSKAAAATHVLMDLESSSRSDSSKDPATSSQKQSTRSYASVVAETALINQKSEQKQSYASVVTEVASRILNPERNQATKSYASVDETAPMIPELKQKQPIGLLERARSQRPKKPTYYYWPSWRHFPVLEELSAPLQPPSQDEAASIPEIIISEPPSSSPRSSTLTPLGPPDTSRLTPRTNPRAKVVRKCSDSEDRASLAQSRDLNGIAPKPSLFSYNICTHPRCPISRPHDKGFFHHGDEDRYFLEISMRDFETSRIAFGPSNPPPEICKLSFPNTHVLIGRSPRVLRRASAAFAPKIYSLLPSLCPQEDILTTNP